MSNDLEIGVSSEERAFRRKLLEKDDLVRKQWAQEDRAEIALREEALAPPVITESRCHVCTSPYRLYIERQLVKGYSNVAIAKSVPPDQNGKIIDRRSIAKHWKSHMRIDDAAIRAELEHEAELLKQNYEEGVKGALTDRGVLKALVRRAYQDAIDGVTTVEPRDLISMIKLLKEIETDTASMKSEETEAMMRIFMKAIQNVCDSEIQIAISEEIKRLRTMDDIELEMEDQLTARQIDPPEVEVVEDE